MSINLSEVETNPTVSAQEIEELLHVSRASGEDAEDGKPEYSTNSKTLLSFVIPVKDEAATLMELRNRIVAHVPDEYDFEIVFIDDGSSDGSWNVISLLAVKHPNQVRGIRFRSNAGKAAGLSAGFEAARGDIIFTLDGDLQDDPCEIPRFLEKLKEGYGLVTGWKKVRHDPWHKVLPSRVFNWMLSHVSGVKLHDHNCGFKCYQGELARQLSLHGELHRMVPSLAAMKGFESAEIVVQHHPRQFGKSKYGIERFLRGFSDMLTMGFLRRFRERPAHCMIGLSAALVTFATAFALLAVWLGLTSTSGLMSLVAALICNGTAVTVFVCGLLGELIIRGALVYNRTLPISADTAMREDSRALNSPYRLQTL